MIKFDLLNLSNEKEDIGAKSWICVNRNGIFETVNIMMDKIITKENNGREKILKNISNVLNSSVTPLRDVFTKNRNIPLPLILELLKFFSIKEQSMIRKEINKKIRFLKCNSNKSQKIKPVKKLSITICKIIGAIMADGNITRQIGVQCKNIDKLKEIIATIKKILPEQKFPINQVSRTRFRITFVVSKNNLDNVLTFLPKDKEVTIWNKSQIDLTDQDLKAVIDFKNWIKECFGIEVRIKKISKKNAWRINFDNKIISRILIKFFDVPIGNKTDFVFEPKIIKNSTLNFRKSFMIGVMSFDGSVSKDGTTELLLKSKILRDDISQIAKLSGFKYSKTEISDKKGRWNLRFSSTKKSRPLLLQLFEPGINKRLRLQGLC